MDDYRLDFSHLHKWVWEVTELVPKACNMMLGGNKIPCSGPELFLLDLVTP